MIANVVFDMDGVLFDTERISTMSWAAVGRELGMPEMAEAIHDYMGLNGTDSRARFTAAFGERISYDEWSAHTRAWTDRWIAEHGLPVKPGVRELLTYLRHARMGVALATSTSRARVMDFLRRTELVDFFQQIVTGDMVLHGKPEPDIYQLACQRLGADPAQTAAVEDSYNGLRSAAAAGLIPIMVPDLMPPLPELAPAVYRVCDSLLDVIDVIEEARRSDT